MVKKDDEQVSTGAPVRFSADEVAALVRGEMPEERIARILEANPGPLGPPLQRGGKRKSAPIELSAKELAGLGAGETSADVQGRLEKAAAVRRPRDLDRKTAKPRLRPTGTGRRQR